MTTILRFPKRNNDVKKSLRALLELAESGEIEGAIWIIRKRSGSHNVGMAGSYRSAPDTAVEIARKALKKIEAYAEAKRRDPASISNVM